MYTLRGFGDVQSELAAAAAKWGIDPNLLTAVAKQESGFKQGVTSGKGAIGVMQLMPATAASLGVNPNDELQNIDGGAKLLSQLLNQYGGNESLALAAYNAGPSAVAKFGGVPPYAETQNYVNSILGSLGQSTSAPFVYEMTGPPVLSSTSPSDSSSPFDFSDLSASFDPTTLIAIAAAVGIGLIVLAG